MTEILTMSDVARAAIWLVQKGWTATGPAVNAKGKVCPAFSKDAVAWSMLGAIAAVGDCVRVDRLKIQLIGRLKVFLPKDTLLSAADTSQEAAVAWLTKGIQGT